MELAHWRANRVQELRGIHAADDSDSRSIFILGGLSRAHLRLYAHLQCPPSVASQVLFKGTTQTCERFAAIADVPDRQSRCPATSEVRLANPSLGPQFSSVRPHTFAVHPQHVLHVEAALGPHLSELSAHRVSCHRHTRKISRAGPSTRDCAQQQRHEDDPPPSPTGVPYVPSLDAMTPTPAARVAATSPPHIATADFQPPRPVPSPHFFRQHPPPRPCSRHHLFHVVPTLPVGRKLAARRARNRGRAEATTNAARQFPLPSTRSTAAHQPSPTPMGRCRWGEALQGANGLTRPAGA